MKVTITREVTETKEAEVLYKISPHVLARLEIRLSDAGKPLATLPSPDPYAIEPKYDYMLVRVLR